MDIVHICSLVPVVMHLQLNKVRSPSSHIAFCTFHIVPSVNSIDE